MFGNVWCSCFREAGEQPIVCVSSLCSPGHLIQVNTNAERVDANTFVLGLEQVDSINHVVVFLTGQVPFSPEFGGAIYFGWPSPESGGICWQFLGYISNDKPSAIFKLAKVKPSEVLANPFSQQLMDTLVSSQSPTDAQIGILVEPLMEIGQKTASQDTEASKVDNFTEFAQKMLESLFNYTSSFAVSPSQTLMQPNTNYVPVDTLQSWYTNFQRRLQANPNFWKTL